ncbi:MAG: STAS domain-containing protein [Planctomycetota bacterium]|jgi:hypothetical protein
MMDDTNKLPPIIRGVKHEGRAIVLELGGEIDMKCSAKVKDKFKEIYQDKPSVIVVGGCFKVVSSQWQ